MAGWLTMPEYFRTLAEAERRAQAVAQRLPEAMQVFVLEEPQRTRAHGGGYCVCFAGWVSDIDYREGRIVAAITGEQH